MNKFSLVIAAIISMWLSGFEAAMGKVIASVILFVFFILFMAAAAEREE